MLLHVKHADDGRDTFAHVRLDRLAHNVRVLKSRLAPNVRLMASVKADGYGHGAVPVSRAVLAAGADQLGVATLSEALALRDAGIASDILLYGALPARAYRTAVEARLQVTVFDEEGIRHLAEAARLAGLPGRAHVKIDTGMTRLGVRGAEAAAALLARVANTPSLVLEGAYTHFACADEPLDAQDGETERQRERFERALAAARRAGVRIPVVHAANSAALLRGARYHYDMVRPGIALYGYHPAPSWCEDIGLEPVLSLHTRVVRVADVPAGTGVSYGHAYVTPAPERIATLPVGYADGIPRAWSNKGMMRVAGAAARIAGRVCMDQTMLACGSLAVSVGDLVTIYGEKGNAPGSIERAATELDTIPYELLCAISGRVPRRYGEMQDILQKIGG